MHMIIQDNDQAIKSMHSALRFRVPFLNCLINIAGLKMLSIGFLRPFSGAPEHVWELEDSFRYSSVLVAIATSTWRHLRPAQCLMLCCVVWTAAWTNMYRQEFPQWQRNKKHSRESVIPKGRTMLWADGQLKIGSHFSPDKCRVVPLPSSTLVSNLEKGLCGDN